LATIISFPIVFGMFHFYIFSLWAYWDIAPEIPIVLSSTILMLCYWRMEYFVPLPLHNRNNKKTTLLHKAIELPFWYVIMFFLYAHLNIKFNLGENLNNKSLHIPLLWGYAAFFALSFLYVGFRTVVLSTFSELIGKAREISSLFDRVFSIFIIYLLVALMFSSIYRFLSHWEPSSFNAPLESWMDSMYFSVVTITTLGYGEIHPTQAISKILVVSEVLLGLLLLVVMLGTAISTSFFEAADSTEDNEHNNAN